VIPVGPYEFTLEDARNTLRGASTMIHQMAEGRRADSIAHLAKRIDELLTGVEPMTMTADDVAPLLGSVWAVLGAAPATLRALGDVVPTATGRVDQLNSGSGGVPKRAVEEVWVGWRGVEGDVQRERKHHGRPFQALCLWSSEIVDELRSAGHPIFPGAAGENVTIGGLPWEDVRPGSRLRIGEVTCEVWAYAVPCKKNARWMADGDFTRLHHDRRAETGRSLSRVYATVTERGTIRTGDPVILEP